MALVLITMVPLCPGAALPAAHCACPCPPSVTEMSGAGVTVTQDDLEDEVGHALDHTPNCTNYNIGASMCVFMFLVCSILCTLFYY